jgi:hypothetical protein
MYINSGRKGPVEETSQSEEVVSQEIANFLRDKSREGQLTSREELLQHLIDGKKLPATPEEQATAFESALRRAFNENQDLQEAADPNGLTFFCSSHHMTEAYASILLRKKGSPLVLMAGIVRENSAVYPRPIPLDTFKQPPFDMTEDDIKTCLQQMENQGEYADIRQTMTSIGTIYLFSSTHLEPDHASMLAEWLDVGQFQSP